MTEGDLYYDRGQPPLHRGVGEVNMPSEDARPVLPASQPDSAVVRACAVLFAVYDEREADAVEKIEEMDERELMVFRDMLIDTMLLLRGRRPTTL